MSEVTYGDETGWRIGAKLAWLWVFTNKYMTVYAIRFSRGHKVVEEIMGIYYDGVLVTDFFSAYDPLPYEKGKCIAHILRRLSKIKEEKERGAVRFSREATRIFREALALKALGDKIDERVYAQRRKGIEERMDRLLSVTIR
jgi:hypothetical protein